MFTILSGYVVRSTDLAIAFVSNEGASNEGAKVLELPRKKFQNLVECDSLSKNIETAKYGLRVGFPVTLEADSAFLERVHYQA